jgi:UDP-perosamine 4-acetyltransferase
MGDLPGRGPAGLVVWGAGGHALSVEALLLSRGLEVATYVVDPGTAASPRLGPVIFGEDALVEWLSGRQEDRQYLVAIGLRGRVRAAKAGRLDALGLTAATVSHPSAILAASARIGAGTQVFAGAVVGPHASVGRHAILNTGCCVEHECRVGDFADLAPHAVLLGGAEIGDNVVVGANATVLEGRRICDDVFIGAGSVVIADIEAPGTYAGVPARPVR